MSQSVLMKGVTSVHGVPIRVGVIGTNFGAHVHLPALSVLPECEITAICGLDVSRLERIADAYDLRLTFTDYRELIASKEVDAITVATPPMLQHPIAVAAAAAHKHLLCEIPMARNANEAREMFRLAETTGITAMVNAAARFLPARVRMKELVDDGYLGALHLVQATFLRPMPYASERWSWSADSEMGGGMLGIVGTPIVDSLRWWFGEIQEVAGATAVLGATPIPRDGTPIMPTGEDTYAFVLRFASGALGNVTCNTTAWQGPGEEVRAFGAEGMLAIAPDGTLWGARRGDPGPVAIAIPASLMGSGIPEVDETPVHPLIPPTIRVMRRWLDGIAARMSPTPSFADGLRVQEVLDAVHRSQYQRKWVDVSGAKWPLASR
jgi:predicted dehydrogenase